MIFNFTNEVRDAALQHLVADFAASALPYVEHELGNVDLDGTTTHVVLSASETHRERFPANDIPAELWGDPLPRDPDARERELERRRSLVAIGVALTVDAPYPDLPELTPGDVAIFIDVEACRRNGERLSVNPDAGIISTFAHELDHAARRHLSDRNERYRPTVEANAQHGMWIALEGVAAEPRWADLMHDAQQVALNLARRQPNGYRVLDRYDEARYGERRRHPRAWGVQLIEDVESLCEASTIRMQVDDTWKDIKIGSRIYVSTPDGVLGPYRVTSARGSAIVLDASLRRGEPWTPDGASFGRVPVPLSEEQEEDVVAALTWAGEIGAEAFVAEGRRRAAAAIAEMFPQ